MAAWISKTEWTEPLELADFGGGPKGSCLLKDLFENGHIV